MHHIEIHNNMFVLCKTCQDEAGVGILYVITNGEDPRWADRSNRGPEGQLRPEPDEDLVEFIWAHGRGDGGTPPQPPELVRQFMLLQATGGAMSALRAIVEVRAAS